MTIAVDDFGACYAALHDGAAPFTWQRRLLDAVLEAGRWPEHVVAPTGAGKTAVIDVHVFAVALMAAGAGPRVPRRLALVVDRRALVDSQYDLACAVRDALEAAPEGSLIAEMAGWLASLRSERDPSARALAVSLLRGGVAPMRRWVDDPSAAAVVCATPAMWGSRLLFRGYGSGRRARPREAGLFAYDSVVVVDEAHLARQLVATARHLEVLESMASHPVGVPVLQVVEATATLPAAGVAVRSVGVEPADLVESDQVATRLARRMLTPKPVAVVPCPGWPAVGVHGRPAVAKLLADEAEQLLASHGRTVACIANTVAVALAAAAELRKRGRVVELLVGRMRPHDVAELRRRRPGLLATGGDPDVDILVATQTVEVGLDADFAAMVTELAPGSSLAQRAGRVNRLGARQSAEVRVLVPDGPLPGKGAPPYRMDDLAAGLEWVTRRASADGALAPYRIAQDPPPPAALPRLVLGRPEPGDARFLARTSDRLFAEPDLELWLADDLDPDEDVGVVVRAGLGHGPVADMVMLATAPVRAEECFPAGISTVRTLLERHPDLARYVVRGDEIEPLAEPSALRPGDIVVTTTEALWFEAGVVTEAGAGSAGDILEALGEPYVVRIGAGLPLEKIAGSAQTEWLLLGLADAVDETVADGRARRDLMAAAIDGVIARSGGSLSTSAVERLRQAQRLLRRRLADTLVEMAPSTSLGDPPWVVIADMRALLDDEQVRQTWAGAETPLAVHQDEVAGRAAALATHLGLDADLAFALREAGALHDEGKRDRRFQQLLGHRAPGATDPPALAKSGRRTPAEYRAAQSACGLPTGWRHEQLSAAVASARRRGADTGGDVGDLVIRLVGTSHGAGRSGFPHPGTGLCPDPDSLGDDAPAIITEAGRLFDDGDWDSIVESTHRAHGYWGCAYLEALLRAADGQVSREADRATDG